MHQEKNEFPKYTCNLICARPFPLTVLQNRIDLIPYIKMEHLIEAATSVAAETSLVCPKIIASQRMHDHPKNDAKKSL